MGNRSPESYFNIYEINQEEYGALGCYDGHSMSADELTKAVKNDFIYFYDINDGYYDDHYIICSKKELSDSQLKDIDKKMSDINNK